MLVYRQLQAEDLMRRQELRLTYHATLAPGVGNFKEFAEQAREALREWSGLMVGVNVADKAYNYRQMYEEAFGVDMDSEEFQQEEYAVAMQYELKYGEPLNVS